MQSRWAAQRRLVPSAFGGHERCATWWWHFRLTLRAAAPAGAEVRFARATCAETCARALTERWAARQAMLRADPRANASTARVRVGSKNTHYGAKN